MITLSHVGTALPQYRYSVEEILSTAKVWLKDDPSAFELFSRFVESSKIRSRYFARPMSDIVALNGAAKRADLFRTEASSLGVACLRDAIAANSLKPSEVDSLIFTSVTTPVVPSVDADITEALGMPRNAVRIPMYQHGCAGGAVGLALAGRLAALGHTVGVVAVELCSLGYQASDLRGSNLVGSAIFGDGAAAAVVRKQEKAAPGSLRYRDSQSFLLPDSRHLMGYDIHDDGTFLRLDRSLPAALAQSVPSIIKEFLERNELTPADVKHWLFHPGGVRILTTLEEAFQLKREQSRWAWDVLESCGNMSSASILFVLSRFLESGERTPGDKVVLFGVGPGLTIELILFECH